MLAAAAAAAAAAVPTLAIAEEAAHAAPMRNSPWPSSAAASAASSTRRSWSAIQTAISPMSAIRIAPARSKSPRCLSSRGGPRRKRSRTCAVILDDKSVDAVFICTCNHWHALAAIWAMQAGKDAYVEKPVSHNVSEGRRMVQVARKTGRICQGGTQYRSSGANAAAVEYMRQGKLGEVKLARSIVYGRRGSIGDAGNVRDSLRRRLQPVGWPGARCPRSRGRSCNTIGIGSGTPATASWATTTCIRSTSAAGASA